MAGETSNARARDSNARARERSLGEWLWLVRDGWPALVVVLLVGLGLGVLVTLNESDEFEATNPLVLSPGRGFLDPQDADKLPDLADTLARTADSPRGIALTREAFVARARLSSERAARAQIASPAWIIAHTSATREAASSIIDVNATASTSRAALDLARSAAGSLGAVVRGGQGFLPGAAKGRGIGVVSLDARDLGQVSPNPERNLLIGLLAGTMLGLVGAALLGAVRQRRWAREDFEREVR